ncbi:MAG: EAL domain-containing protein [Acidobacteriota bacterium]
MTVERNSAVDPLRVLLIEDDTVDQMAFQRFVQQHSLPYAVTLASSAAEARRRLEGDTFDIVLTDYHLGDATGIEIIESRPGIPVIIITGAGDEETAVRAIRAGAYDYLVKDSERRYLKVMRVTIDKALEHHASEVQTRELAYALAASEERYALAAAGSNDGLWDWDLRSSRIFFSARWKAILGFDEDEVRDEPESWFSRVHPDDFELLEAQLKAHLEGVTPHFENEHRIRTLAGEYIWVQTRGVAVRDESGKAYRIAGSQRDVSEWKRAEEQLTHAALHDALTGLPNRALFMDRLDNAVKRFHRKSKNHFGVIFLDLDRFKVINDSLGHLAGDKLLRSIARRLESCLRIGDTVARLGGDEFAILLEDISDVIEVDRVADRIDQALEKPFHIQGHEFFTGASLGIALSSTGYDRPEDLLRDADTAMYRAKAEGRTRRVVFDPAMHEGAMTRLHLENDLRRAVDRQEFLVYYQPLVGLDQGRLDGFEALVRWHHPERGVLGPDDFLPVAQETGLAARIGWWVLAEASRRLKAWQERFPWTEDLVVSVNLDAGQLASTEVLERVESELAATELSPRCLQLEITEATLIENPELTRSILNRLHAQGIRLHIDDFGTGYSSLSQLHRYPVDTLKIDRSFVNRMNEEAKDLEIVRTIVLLAHNMQMRVMAEGVETLDQLQQLIALDCELAQGYFFAKPLAPGAVEDLLESGPTPFASFPAGNGAGSAVE